jgi:hypothetical protein
VGDLVVDYGYPSKVTTLQEIESAAFLARSALGTVSSPEYIPTLISHITKTISEDIQNFNKECNHYAGTTKIFDADGRTELSLDSLLTKYFST